MQRNEGRALQPGSSHFRGKKKKEVFLKIILITKCSSSLQNLPIADWLQNTGQTSYLLCKSWALRKQITNWHLSPPKGKQITENKGREALSRTPQAARGGTRRAPAAMLPAPCRAPSPATAVPPPPPPRTATHLCLPSRSLASAGKLRGSCRKTRSLLTQPEAPSRPPLPAPRRGRRRHSLGAASNHRGKGEEEGRVRRGAAPGQRGPRGAASLPGRELSLAERCCCGGEWLGGPPRCLAPPACAPRPRPASAARSAGPGAPQGERRQRPPPPGRARRLRCFGSAGTPDSLRETRGCYPGGGTHGASPPAVLVSTGDGCGEFCTRPRPRARHFARRHRSAHTNLPTMWAPNTYSRGEELLAEGSGLLQIQFSEINCADS